jgi:hypothetical protein
MAGAAGRISHLFATHRCVLLSAVAAACSPSNVLAPDFFEGSWRGREWGIEADATPLRVHDVCGYTARVLELRWAADLTFEGTAEWPWNSDPTGPDLVFAGRALTPSMLELDPGAPGGALDTLLRTSDARFRDVICD